MRTTLFALATVLAFSSMAQDDLADGLYARFQTTKGTITLKLEFEKTPLTVANFVGLAEGTKKFEAQGREAGKPYFDGLGFHRVIADFMIQGGCPLGTGTGGPGYRFVDEIDPTLKHVGPLSFGTFRLTLKNRYFLSTVPRRQKSETCVPKYPKKTPKKYKNMLKIIQFTKKP